MLVLKFEEHEAIRIGDKITIKLLRRPGHQGWHVGIAAPRELKIKRVGIVSHPLPPAESEDHD